MLHKPMKTVVLSIVLLFVAASLAFAAGQSGKTSQTGMQSKNSITATVQDVNQEEKKLELRTQDGETVELTVSDSMISELQKGDRVEVSIRKQGSGMGGSQPGQTGSGMQKQPGQPGRTQ